MAGSTFAGVIQDGGISGSLAIANGAVQQLSGTNPYTGTTTITTDGELDLVNVGTANDSTATSSAVINNGMFSILALTNGGTSIRSLSSGGSSTVNLANNTLTIIAANGYFAGVVGDRGLGGNLD